MVRLCSKCGAELADSRAVCGVCGAALVGVESPRRTPGLPVEAAVWGAPFGLKSPRPAVGVPRRFGVGTMMILMTAFIVLFGILKTAGVDPIIFAAVSLFIGGVAVCQVLLFKGGDPRKASFFGGLITAGVLAVVAALVTAFVYRNLQLTVEAVFYGGLLAVLFGGPLGYAAGCLVAAIFLVRKEPGDAGASGEEAAESTRAADAGAEAMRLPSTYGTEAAGFRGALGTCAPFEGVDPAYRPAELPVLMAMVVEEPFRMKRPAPAVGVPRRFSIGTMMILVTAFAVIFAIMKTLETPPACFGAIAIFIGGVAACQALLFKGQNPRLASFLSGIVMFFLTVTALVAVNSLSSARPPQVVTVVGSLLGLGLASMFCGGPLGYVVGCLVAAIFLVRKETDDSLPTAEEPAGKMEDSTLGESPTSLPQANRQPVDLGGEDEVVLR
jgi:hypothetical protein